MVQRGGGVFDITFRTIPKSQSRSRFEKTADSHYTASTTWLIVHIHLDVCDAMGANNASHVAEGIAPLLAKITGARVGPRIVSNLCVDRLAKASFRIPVNKMGYKHFTGVQVASQILEAYEWAKDDPFRATTHNKGIMNGIDAVALATGQDWRAIEAAAHSWACQSHSEDEAGYKPLTKYWIEDDGLHGGDESGTGAFFCGELELPVAVGTRGGVLKTNPVYNYTLGVMGNPDAKDLAKVLVCIGLAQNFAALRALATEGIQRGHMSLHARNIAVAAGAPPHAINECVAYMIECNRINLDAAQEYVMAHALHEDIWHPHSHERPRTDVMPPSMFYFEEKRLEGENTAADNTHEKDRVTLNIAFRTLGSKPVHIELTEEASTDPLVSQLLGNKTHAWLTMIFRLLDKIHLSTIKPCRSNYILAKKLKYLSILLNIVIRRLMFYHPGETRRFVLKLLGSSQTRHAKSATQSSMDDDGKVASTQSAAEQQRRGITNLSFLNNELFSEDLMTSSSAREPSLLQIGLPLLLALWQVFEHNVKQWVGHRTLAKTLVSEQRNVVDALVQPLSTDDPDVHVSKPDADFAQFMSVHAKRFQVTIFLLCDAIQFDPEFLTKTSLDFMVSFGSHLEWEQSVTHDLSPQRLERDLQLACRGLSTDTAGSAISDLGAPGLSIDGSLDHGKIVNSFLFWLHVVKRWSIDDIWKTASKSVNGAHVEILATSPMVNDLPYRAMMDDHPIHELFLEHIDEFLSHVASLRHLPHNPAENSFSSAGFILPVAFMEAAKSQPSEVFDFHNFTKALIAYRKYYGLERLHKILFRA
ncbi:hypothetical protein HK102_014149 [Quaeritorhiza haematococci]|nr:hypothetical protein HK102_014149 [Quaeritorhiza haematococci]